MWVHVLYLNKSIQIATIKAYICESLVCSNIKTIKLLMLFEINEFRTKFCFRIHSTIAFCNGQYSTNQLLLCKTEVNSRWKINDEKSFVTIGHIAWAFSFVCLQKYYPRLITKLFALVSLSASMYEKITFIHLLILMWVCVCVCVCACTHTNAHTLTHTHKPISFKPLQI